MQIMTKNVLTRYFNRYGFLPRCNACLKSILTGQPHTIGSGKSGTPTNYFCESCSKKEILVYQPNYRKRRNQHGIYKIKKEDTES